MLTMVKTDLFLQHEKELNAIFQNLKTAINLSEDEILKMKNNLAVKIIIFTTYNSNCIKPNDILFRHLLLFIATIRCPNIFQYKDDETIEDRLSPLNYFPGGNKDTIKAGMLLLELLSLNDANTDYFYDIIEKKSNPLHGSMIYTDEKERIISEFKKLPYVVKNDFDELYFETITAGYWW